MQLDQQPAHCGRGLETTADRDGDRTRKAKKKKKDKTNKTDSDSQVSSMRALVVLPLLLCAVAHVEQVSAEVKAVKLCGREFLRAVVYTCGGSRWRRFLSETDLDGDGLPAGEQNSLESLSSSSSIIPGSQLSRRDINNILTTVCCQVGCRKSDLTFLC